MACDAPGRRWGSALTLGRVASTAAGIGCLAVAGLLSPEPRDEIAAMSAVAGAVLLMSAGFPIAAAVDAGHPLGRVLAAFVDRRQGFCTLIRGRVQHSLFEVAADMVLDNERALHLVEQAIERAASRWRGSVDARAELFVYCWVVQLALRDLRTDPPLAPGDPRTPLLAYARRDRAILAMRRQAFPERDIAAVLGCAEHELPAAYPPGGHGP